jgi:hypothetical protein
MHQEAVVNRQGMLKVTPHFRNRPPTSSMISYVPTQARNS